MPKIMAGGLPVKIFPDVIGGMVSHASHQLLARSKWRATQFISPDSLQCAAWSGHAKASYINNRHCAASVVAWFPYFEVSTKTTEDTVVLIVL